jgi:hypothetical protein
VAKKIGGGFGSGKMEKGQANRFRILPFFPLILQLAIFLV